MWDAGVVEDGSRGLITGLLVELTRRDLRVQRQALRAAAARLLLEEPEQRQTHTLPTRIVHDRHAPDLRDPGFDQDEPAGAGQDSLERCQCVNGARRVVLVHLERWRDVLLLDEHGPTKTQAGAPVGFAISEPDLDHQARSAAGVRSLPARGPPPARGRGGTRTSPSPRTRPRAPSS